MGVYYIYNSSLPRRAAPSPPVVFSVYCVVLCLKARVDCLCKDTCSIWGHSAFGNFLICLDMSFSFEVFRQSSLGGGGAAVFWCCRGPVESRGVDVVDGWRVLAVCDACPPFDILVRCCMALFEVQTVLLFPLLTLWRVPASYCHRDETLNGAVVLQRKAD